MSGQMVHWYYAVNGNRVGPLTPQQLKAAADAHQFGANDLVWREGMADWVPAGRIKNLLPPEPPSVNYPPYSHQVPPQQPYGAPYQQQYSSYMPPRVKPVSYASILWSFLLGCLFVIVLAAIAPTVENKISNDAVIIIGLLTLFAFSALIYSTVMIYVVVYRSWKCVQSLPDVRTTPGKGVGFLFIPFFNFYWYFVAYHGWAKDCNKMRQEQGLMNAPQVSEGVFLTYCITLILSIVPVIGGLFWIVAMIMLLIALKQQCRVINYFAHR